MLTVRYIHLREISMKISAIFIFPCIKILWPDFCGFAILSFVGCNLALHYTQLLKWAVTTRCDGNKNFAAIIIQTEGVHLNVILIFISSMQLNATTVYFVEFFIFLPSTLENMEFRWIILQWANMCKCYNIKNDLLHAARALIFLPSLFFFFLSLQLGSLSCALILCVFYFSLNIL